ncbi:hypothetical protein E3N88_40705 [Mikania micrantha]|uniref:Uncharacterized protein n=1 Tax=Mikania micrantha TaxID=192012 RepID=A0A5N6LQQ8_9ASTR|nr:hypothetical protein E3N88_40705 [Mikania micrantha]
MGHDGSTSINDYSETVKLFKPYDGLVGALVSHVGLDLLEDCHDFWWFINFWWLINKPWVMTVQPSHTVTVTVWLGFSSTDIYGDMAWFLALECTWGSGSWSTARLSRPGL